MTNPIEPMVTNLPSSGKSIKLSADIEFDVDAHGAGRAALVQWLTSSMGYDQMIPLQVNVEAAQTDYNLWTAPAGIKARAVAMRCLYGGGAVAINSGNTPTGFPLIADATNGDGWMIYNNPGGAEITVGGIPTGGGIQDIKVSTENESRFLVLVFI